MQTIFWLSVALTVIALISVVVTIKKSRKLFKPNRMILLITTGKAVLAILGTVLILAITGMFIALARAASTNVEEESKDIPGYEDDYTYTERPFNPYEMYN